MKLINHLIAATLASGLAFGAYADNESTDAAKDHAKEGSARESSHRRSMAIVHCLPACQ